MKLVSLTLLLFYVEVCYGHGRLISPPGRSTMWRYGYNTPVNTNDNQLSCGGFGVGLSLSLSLSLSLFLCLSLCLCLSLSLSQLITDGLAMN